LYGFRLGEYVLNAPPAQIPGVHVLHQAFILARAPWKES
jgi:hypothetical protein